jgi:hypothetical protein
VIVVFRIAAELAPLDAAVVRAVQVVHPDLVVQPVLAFPIVPQDHELVAAVSVDVGDRGDATAAATTSASSAAVHAAEVRGAERVPPEGGESQGEDPQAALRGREDREEALDPGEQGPRDQAEPEGKQQEAQERLQGRVHRRQVAGQQILLAAVI